MFACYRRGLQQQRDDVATRFDPEVAKLAAAVAAIAAKGVSPDDAELKKTQELLEAAKHARDAAVAPFDQALAELDTKAKEIIDTFLSGNLDLSGGDANLVDNGDGDGEEHTMRMLSLAYEPA